MVDEPAIIVRFVTQMGRILIWPALAPGEADTSRGTPEPLRPNESIPVTRLRNIRLPTMEVFLAPKPNGTAVLVLPGGGFVKVVPDKEGSEVAPFLNAMALDFGWSSIARAL